MSAIRFIDIVQDIHAMDEELWHYEKRYGLRSSYFYTLYKSGQLKDEDPTEVRDYTDWAACYEIKQHREELYDSLVTKVLAGVTPQQAVSLAQLKLTLEPVGI